MQGAAAAQLTQRSASPNQLMRRPNSEHPPPKHAAKAEYSRREQQDTAGLGDRRRAAPAGQREGFRRNRANGVLIGCGRSAVLIPVDRVANGAAGGGAGIVKGYIAR